MKTYVRINPEIEFLLTSEDLKVMVKASSVLNGSHAHIAFTWSNYLEGVLLSFDWVNYKTGKHRLRNFTSVRQMFVGKDKVFKVGNSLILVVCCRELWNILHGINSEFIGTSNHPSRDFRVLLNRVQKQLTYR